jgi:biotin carboxyl carrier protein
MDNGSFFVDRTEIPFEVLETSESEFSLLSGTTSLRVVAKGDAESMTFLANGIEVHVRVETVRQRLLKQFGTRREKGDEVQEIRAPMPALVVDIEVLPGQQVKAGQGLIILEAMKMENEIRAHREGIVKEVWVKKGMTVEKGDLMIRFGQIVG